MKSLIDFILRHYFAILFFLLEFFNLFLIIEFNSYQKQIFYNFSNDITGKIYETVYSITSYLNLKEENKSLLKENAKLKNLLTAKYFQSNNNFTEAYFEYIPTNIIYKSLVYENNFFLINKGQVDGIQPNTAVVSPQGIIGVVFKTSPHFSSVLSILNTKTAVSAKMKKNNYTCLVKWDGKDYRYGKIENLPTYIKVSEGDTIVTSGFSAIFPPGILIGTVKNIKKKEQENFYDITIRFTVNFKIISNAYVIHNRHKQEINNLLQNSTIDE